MFGINTGEEIPRKYLTDHDAWDHFVGDIWHSLIQAADIEDAGSVVEIAPGNSMKVGYGLEKIRFKGKLYLVDASQRILDIMAEKYQKFLPGAEIIPLCSQIENCAEGLPDQVDCIFANHVIDDMLLYHDQPESVTSWAAAYKHIPSDDIQMVWKKMEANAYRLGLVKKSVAECLIRLFSSKVRRGVIFSQYPSSTLYDHGMGSLNGHAYDVFEMVKKGLEGTLAEKKDIQETLNQHPNFGNLHIGEHLLNAKYWVTMCR